MSRQRCIRNILQGLAASSQALKDFNQDHLVPPQQEEDQAAITVETSDPVVDHNGVRLSTLHHRQVAERERKHEISKRSIGGVKIVYLGSPRSADRLLAHARM